ncbi:hypothetical protein [Bradyrhizobium elkanii]|uniref:hypothetical protein n=1 Tax=Bradyrhizobium elkanii TaxID=29448 RepID=UPI0004B7B8BA|nr:hypothetical protein [Bradyrhizobium elkanii]WLA83244.1 hypothetical protein QNJ99_02575 [Bradyrhizobium elkanii]
MTTRSKTKKVSVRRIDPPAPPTAWWRTIRADYFDATTAKLLREAIENVAILGEPAWCEAAKGDAGAAIKVALRLRPDTSPMIYDLVMTALAACAAEESGAATLAMSQMVYRCPGAGRAEARVATSWLTRSFGKIVRSKSKVGGVR